MIPQRRAFIESLAAYRALRRAILKEAQEAQRSFYLWLHRAKLQPERLEECTEVMRQRATEWLSLRDDLRQLRWGRKKHGLPFHVIFNTPL